MPSRAFASRRWLKLAPRVLVTGHRGGVCCGVTRDNSDRDKRMAEGSSTANKGRYRFGFTRLGAVARCIERTFCNSDTSRESPETRSQNNANAPFAGRLPDELEKIPLSYLPNQLSHRFSYLFASLSTLVTVNGAVGGEMDYVLQHRRCNTR
jgi:hypothetical protein